jgi:hypothetical protein
MAAVDVTASLVYSGNTDAGAATVSASWAGDANHADSTGTSGFAIAKADSTVTVSCPASVTFTGAAQTPCTAAATGAGMAAVDVTASLSYANNTGAGAATVNASWAGDANHANSTGTGGFAITPAVSTVTVSCPASATFTGAAIEPCTAAVSGAGGLTGSVAVSYSANINAGTAAASATHAGDANHAGSTARASSRLRRRPQTVAPGVSTFAGAAIERARRRCPVRGWFERR